MDLQLESLKTSSRCHFSLCRWVETGACWEASCMYSYPFLQFAMDVLPGGPLNDCTTHTPVPVGPANTSSSSVRVHYFELAGSHKQEQTPAAQGRKVRQCCKSKFVLGPRRVLQAAAAWQSHIHDSPHCVQGKVEPGQAVGGDMSSDGHSPSSAPSPEESY